MNIGNFQLGMYNQCKLQLPREDAMRYLQLYVQIHRRAAAFSLKPKPSYVEVHSIYIHVSRIVRYKGSVVFKMNVPV